MNKAENKKERESGFELVRIIAMFMIVANHLVNHGIFKVTSQTPYSLWKTMSPMNQAVGAVLSCGGRIGVAVFFMLTGYFLVDRVKISIRSVFSFLARVHFYGILMFAVFLVLNRVTGYGTGIDLIQTAKRSLCIPAAMWWFALVYLILLFLAPSINVLIRSLHYKALLFSLLIVYIWYFFYATGNGEDIPVNFVKGVLFYMMGAFVRLFEKKREKAAASTSSRRRARTPRKRFSTSEEGLVLHLAIFLAFFILSGFLMFDIIQDINKDVSVIGNILFWNPTDILNNILIPIDALCLLLVGQFKFSSRLVNAISASTFSIYLIHDYGPMRAFLWERLFKTDTVLYQSRFFPILTMIAVVIIFLVGIAVETIRVRMGNLLHRVY